MAEQIKISELTPAGDLTPSAMLPMSQEANNELATFKASFAEVALFVCTSAEFPTELTTEGKTIVDAINELNERLARLEEAE